MTTLKPTHLPKALPPNIITLEIRASTYDLGGGHKHSVYSRQRGYFHDFSPSLPSLGNHSLRLCESRPQAWTCRKGVLLRHGTQMPLKTWWHPLSSSPSNPGYNHHFLDGWRNWTETNEVAFSVYLVDRGKNRNRESFGVPSRSPQLAWEDDPGHTKAKTNTSPSTLQGRDQQNPATTWEPPREQKKQNSCHSLPSVMRGSELL